MKHVKLFETQNDYNSFIGSANFITPNVSLSLDPYQIFIHPEVEAHDYSQDYLTLSILEDGTISIGDMWGEFYNDVEYEYDYTEYDSEAGEDVHLGYGLKYSLDNGETWHRFTNYNTNEYNWNQNQETGDPLSETGYEQVSVHTGDKMLLKAQHVNWMIGDSYNPTVITATCNFNVEGNAMSIIWGDDFIGKTDFLNEYNPYQMGDPEDEDSYDSRGYMAFGSLFMNNTHLINAENLILPATTLESSCYDSMFSGCTSLITLPQLPAAILVSSCYSSMFSGCTSLTTLPSNLLAATTFIDNGSCQYMFKDCTGLLTVPVNLLPATTLSTGGYNYTGGENYFGMFEGCTSLTNIPNLPATVLGDNCYAYMFKDCTSLTGTVVLSASTYAYGAYDGMFDGTNVIPDVSNIDFTDSTIINCRICKGLFKGTKVTDSDLMNMLPINPSTNKYWLPVTTLTEVNCYDSMFSDCTLLTTAPELPATSLSMSCYSEMFNGCISLNTLPELPATTVLWGSYSEMFANCTSLTSIPSNYLSATTLNGNCYKGMFSGCTSLASVPSNLLPATTLASNCYQNMFSGCTSLITAPTLSATTLVNYCYDNMFNGCTSLTSITCLAESGFPTNAWSNNPTNNWVQNVAASGTFTKSANTSAWTTGVSGIPSGWTVQDAS